MKQSRFAALNRDEDAAMTALIIRATAYWDISQTVRLLSLFCLLGITLTTAVVPHIQSNELGWVFTHLE